jgi:hypothetical protein
MVGWEEAEQETEQWRQLDIHRVVQQLHPEIDLAFVPGPHLARELLPEHRCMTVADS